MRVCACVCVLCVCVLCVFAMFLTSFFKTQFRPRLDYGMRREIAIKIMRKLADMDAHTCELDTSSDNKNPYKKEVFKELILVL